MEKVHPLGRHLDMDDGVLWVGMWCTFGFCCEGRYEDEGRL